MVTLDLVYMEGRLIDWTPPGEATSLLLGDAFAVNWDDFITHTHLYLCTYMNFIWTALLHKPVEFIATQAMPF